MQKSRKNMPKQKRALNSTSSGDPSQPKRPCPDPSNQEQNRSERNFMQSSCLTREDVRREVREVVELVISQWANNFEGCMGTAFKEMMRQISSLKNDFQRLMERSELATNFSPHLERANATGENDARNLRLKIQTKVPDTLFTGKKLQGKGGARISVALIDANSGDVIRSGPESSIMLDVVVLKGGFDNDDEDNWTKEEFEKQMVEKRDKKAELLTGNLKVKLEGGLGELGELKFKDNSRWEKSEKFRIGLKVAQNYRENTRIREGKTDAFRVKEGRGESNEKKYPPKLDDEVWRLETIRKDGSHHEKLRQAGIHTVRDFLLKHYNEPEILKADFAKSIKTAHWERLINHATTCEDWPSFVNHSNGMKKHAAVVNTDCQPTSLTEDMNQEDTIGKASSYFPSQVSEQQTENPAPVQRYMAPSTSAPPVGPEAHLANAGSTADGHNDVTGLQSSIESQDTTKDPANAARPPHPLRRVSHASDLFSPFNCQATMPRHGIGSSNRMGCTSNENVSPSMSQRASMSSFPDGHNDVTALPSSVQSQNTYFENPMKSPANGSASLTLRQPTPTECSSAPFSIGENAITTTVSQFQGFPPQPTVPSHVISSLSPMDYTCNGDVPPFEPRHDSSLSFQNGPLIFAEPPKGLTFPGDNGNTTFESPLPFPYDDIGDPVRREMFGFCRDMGYPDFDPFSKAYDCPPGGDYVMECFPSNVADYGTNSADLQNMCWRKNLF